MKIEEQLEDEFIKIFPLIDRAKVREIRLGENSWDSIRHLEVVNAIERRFHIQLSVDEAMCTLDFESCLNVLKAKLSSQYDSC